jgi:hypothetical protein
VRLVRLGRAGPRPLARSCAAGLASPAELADPATAFAALAEVLADPAVAVIHVRAVDFGCFLFEARRG